MALNLFKGAGNRRVNSVLSKDVFRKLRKFFKENCTRIRRKTLSWRKSSAAHFTM